MTKTDPAAQSSRRAGVIQLPPLYCPIPPATHPEASAIDAATFAFMDAFHLADGPRHRARLAAGMQGFAGRLAPRGDRAAVQLLSDLLIWIFSFDDVTEGPLSRRPGELMLTVAQLRRVLDVPEARISDSPTAAALHDIRTRLLAVAPGWVSSWTEAMRGYLFTEACLASMAADDVKPSLNDYVALRMHAGGALAVTQLVLAANGRLDPRPASDQRVAALMEMAASISIWDSDICSFPKECERGQHDHNLIEVLRRTRGDSLQGAYAAAIRLRDRTMCRFLSLGALGTGAAPHADRYAQSLGHYIRGSLDWCLSTVRYRFGEGSPTTGMQTPILVSSMCSETPTDNSPRPPDIDSIAWWWSDHLVSGPEPSDDTEQ
ncbi:terpene synthase family protein [Streptomyces sp. R28]|uniref:Terpene synthase family protein n=1 Tax=Streptomyces sp. R28 TaxID=3238628 RepID=A0AB39PMI8_9ACTN